MAATLALSAPPPLPGPDARQWATLYADVSVGGALQPEPAAPQPSSCAWSWLPAELQLNVLARLDPRTLGLCARLSRAFAALVRHPRLWRRFCEATWRQRFDGRDRPIPKLRQMMLRPSYGSWRALYLNAPRVRTDGVYVSQNFRAACRFNTGARGIRPKNEPKTSSKERSDAEAAYTRSLTRRVPFYRYIRFCADGRAMCLDVCDTPSEVVPNLRSVGRADQKYNNLALGQWEQLSDAVYTRVHSRLKSHPGMKKTERCARLVYDAEVGGLLIRGYHGQVEDEILKYPLDHAPYRLMKWAEVEKRRWAKAE